jgi:tetraacyldisaccharide 4'-kinase
VMILDDGFQHVQLARTVNLLLMSPEDLDEQVLPTGRLREPLDAASRADAVLAVHDGRGADSMAHRLGVKRGFRVSFASHQLRLVRPFGAAVLAAPARVVTVAAIARPERFGNGVRALGYTVQREFTFRDHHWFTAADVRKVEDAARASGADAILTTEKDAVRLERMVTGTTPIVFLPIDAHVEPAEVFRSWLLECIGSPKAVA